MTRDVSSFPRLAFFRVLSVSLSLLLFIPALHAERKLVRSPAGYEVISPAGWNWKSIARDTIIFGSASGEFGIYPESGKGALEKAFELDSTDIGRRILENGEILWYRGEIDGAWRFQGQIARSGRKFRVFDILTAVGSADEAAALEAAFFQIVQSLRVTGELSAVHPDEHFSIEPLQGWKVAIDSGSGHVDLLKDGATIHIYPTRAEFDGLDAMLDDITKWFSSKGIVIGEAEVMDVPGGAAKWVKCSGGDRPILGVIERDGRRFFINVEDPTGGIAGLTTAVRAVIPTIRPREPPAVIGPSAVTAAPVATPAAPPAPTVSPKIREKLRLAYAQTFAIWEALHAVETVTKDAPEGWTWAMDDYEADAILSEIFFASRTLMDRAVEIRGWVRTGLTSALELAARDEESFNAAAALVSELESVVEKAATVSSSLSTVKSELQGLQRDSSSNYVDESMTKLESSLYDFRYGEMTQLLDDARRLRDLARP